MLVHRSNRAETLVHRLAAVCSEPLRNPLAREVVAVQSLGMERWLAQQLALQLGVWAHGHHPFPRRLIDDLLTAVLDDAPAAVGSPFAPEALRWAVASELPRCAHEPGFEVVARYLSDDRLGLKLHQLARQLAWLFDQYVVYRPDVVLAWEDGADPDDWQATLWRALVQRLGGLHLARRAHAFQAAWPRAELDQLPERICVFGVSTLPPLFLQLLTVVGECLPVHLFLLTPTPHYTGDLMPRRALRKRRRDARRAGRQAAGGDEGNPLLASLGRLGRELQQVLIDLEAVASDGFVPPPVEASCSTLELLQHDIYKVISRRPESGERQLSFVVSSGERPSPRPLPDTRSLRLHRCHSPMREVEVLRDELRRLLDADPTLQPRDIVVMAPSIEPYAPLVHAVFGVDPAAPGHVPYAVSDRPLRDDSSVIEAFVALLELLPGRLPAPAVLDELSRGPVARRFGLDADDLDALRRYVRESGICWGEDHAHRVAEGQPDHHDHTWRFGLDRMLAGWAAQPPEHELVAGVLPYGEIEGDAADRVGKLADFLQVVFRGRRVVATPATAARWSRRLLALLDSFVSPSDDELWGWQRLRDELASLATDAELGRHDEPVGFEVVQWWLGERLANERAGHRYLSGGVTFCSLLPMRSVPFRVVALVGMGVDRFPRSELRPAFDRMAAEPRPGDRSAREEDRTLFLEAMLSARDHLHISWVGRSIRDNQELPPSVVVSELRDWLDEAFTPLGDALDKLETDHPLQPFSPDYFDASTPLLSTSEPYARGALASLGAREAPPPFLAHALPVEAASDGPVDLRELSRFLQHPAQALVEGRLGIRPPRELEPLSDREPLLPGGLERYQIAQPLLAPAIRGVALEELWGALRASGQLPAGVTGRCVFEELAPLVADVAEAVRPLLEGEALEPVAAHVELPAGAVHGWLSSLWPGGQVLYRFAKLQAKHELDAWVRHLVLCAAAHDAPLLPTRTLLVGRHPRMRRAIVVAFDPVADAVDRLSELTGLLERGRHELVPLVPTASMAYVRARQSRRDSESWRVNLAQQRVDDLAAEDAAWGLALRGAPPLVARSSGDDGFCGVARRVFEPLLEARTEVRR